MINFIKTNVRVKTVRITTKRKTEIKCYHLTMSVEEESQHMSRTRLNKKYSVKGKYLQKEEIWTYKNQKCTPWNDWILHLLRVGQTWEASGVHTASADLQQVCKGSSWQWPPARLAETLLAPLRHCFLSGAQDFINHSPFISQNRIPDHFCWLDRSLSLSYRFWTCLDLSLSPKFDYVLLSISR